MEKEKFSVKNQENPLDDYESLRELRQVISELEIQYVEMNSRLDDLLNSFENNELSTEEYLQKLRELDDSKDEIAKEYEKFLRLYLAMRKVVVAKVNKN